MEEKEIEDFMKSYSSAFRPGNSNKMERFYCYPTTMLSGEMRIILETGDEVSSAISAGLEALESNGFSHSELLELHIHKLTQESAIVSATYNRLKTDGSILEKIAATYNLFKENGDTWKVLMTTTHGIDGLIKNV